MEDSVGEKVIIAVRSAVLLSAGVNDVQKLELGLIAF